MPIQFIDSSQPTNGDLIRIQKYNEWLADPKYIRVVRLFSKYAVAILPGKIELRQLIDVLRHSGFVAEWSIVARYDIENDQLVGDWVFIHRGYDANENQIFNDELKANCISAYRETVNDKDRNEP